MGYELKPKPNRLSSKSLKRATPDEDTTEMERKALELERKMNNVHASMLKVCSRSQGLCIYVKTLDKNNSRGCIDAEVKAYIGKVMASLSMQINDSQEMTQDLIDMEATIPSTNVVNAHFNIDMSRCRNIISRMIGKSQAITQEVINIKASLKELI